MRHAGHDHGRTHPVIQAGDQCRVHRPEVVPDDRHPLRVDAGQRNERVQPDPVVDDLVDDRLMVLSRAGGWLVPRELLLG